MSTMRSDIQWGLSSAGADVIAPSFLTFAEERSDAVVNLQDIVAIRATQEGMDHLPNPWSNKQVGLVGVIERFYAVACGLCKMTS